MLSGWVGMAVGGRHDFAHNHQRTPRGMARADFSSSYSRSCGHIGARNPCRQRRCSEAGALWMTVLDISVIAAMQAGYIGGSALFVAVAD